MAYTTQVGTIMNTAVGIMQAEEIGMIKKTMVGKSYSISVGDKFEISVGSSKITMTPDGIQITAKTILVGAENENVIIGKDVLINPPGAVDGGGSEEEYEYEPNISVDTYDKGGNLTGSHNLVDNPSGLSAMASTKGLNANAVSNNIKACPIINNIELQPRTIEAIETIESKIESGNWL